MFQGLNRYLRSFRAGSRNVFSLKGHVRERNCLNRTRRVDMQLRVDPGFLTTFVAGMGFGLSKSLQSVVYVLSISKALIVAGGTTLIIRPGIVWRAVREGERLLARIIGYRPLTIIADEQVAQAMGSFLLGRILQLVNSPIGISLLAFGGAFISINSLKNWIEFLVDQLRSGQGRLTQSRDIASPRLSLTQDSLIEENRRLRLKIERLERARRFTSSGDEV